MSVHYSNNETPTLRRKKGRAVNYVWIRTKNRFNLSLFYALEVLDFFGTMFFIVPSMEVHTVTWRQKAGLMDQTNAATARQQRSKHVSAAKTKHTTMEEPLNAVFSMWSMPRLYSENHCEKLVSHDSGVGSNQSGSLSRTVRRRYKATTSENWEDIVFAVMICRGCSLMKALQLFIVTSYKRSINPITNSHAMSNN
jgi:hypothetical protein